MIKKRRGKQMKTYGLNISTIILSLLLLFMAEMMLFSPVQAQTLQDKEIEGMWQGVLKYSGIELRIIFTISRSQDNTLTATMDVPEQNATDIPVDKVVFDGSTLLLEITPIEGVFKGKLIEDGERIEGQWMQGGLTLFLMLERTDTKPKINRPQEPKKPFPYHVEEVVFKNTDTDIRLAGTITFPFSEGTFPAVLLLSGSGPQNRDETAFGHRPFLVLADYLTRRGIAVLRVDDRGVGGSTGDFEQATAVDYAADAMVGVTYLKSRKEINHALIGLIGHSEGGMIAPMVAVQTPNIAFMVLIASPGLPIKEMEYSEQARDLKAKGANDDFIAKNRAMKENLFEVIRQEIDGAAVLERFDMIIREFFEGLNEEERKIAEISEENLDAYTYDQAQRLHSPWFRFYLPYDPGTVLKKVACPVLALNGEKDVQVPPKENLQAIERALKAGGNRHYTVKELPNLNHLLQTAETGSISEYGMIEETMSRTALQIIGDWILEQTGVK